MTLEGLILISFTPGLFWLWIFLRLDKYRPEPRRLIVVTFLFGCLSTIPAAILEGIFGVGQLLESDPDLITIATGMLLVVGPIEEICKFSVVRLVPYRSLYFDEPMDGLVYGAAASLGFASLENLVYVLSYGPEVMFFRAPISTLGHLTFGSIWGYALGQHHSSGGGKIELVIGGLALAAVIHALFNIMVFTFPLVAAALVAIGGFLSFKGFRWGQRVSPFRYKRNYPQVECQSCGTLMRALNQFCTSCGAPASSTYRVLICSHCQNQNRPQASYCTHCGDRLLKR